MALRVGVQPASSSRFSVCVQPGCPFWCHRLVHPAHALSLLHQLNILEWHAGTPRADCDHEQAPRRRHRASTQPQCSACIFVIWVLATEARYSADVSFDRSFARNMLSMNFLSTSRKGACLGSRDAFALQHLEGVGQFTALWVDRTKTDRWPPFFSSCRLMAAASAAVPPAGRNQVFNIVKSIVFHGGRLCSRPE